MVEILDSVRTMALGKLLYVYLSFLIYKKGHSCICFLGQCAHVCKAQSQACDIGSFIEVWAVGWESEKLFRVMSEVCGLWERAEEGSCEWHYMHSLGWGSWLCRGLLFFFFWLPPGPLTILQFDDVDAQQNFEQVRYYLVEATFLLSFDLLLALPLHLLS